MTDQRIRELERSVMAGDLGSRAQLLRERIRAGDLLEECVELAAWLGDLTCEDVRGNIPGEKRGRHAQFLDWLAGIHARATWETGRTVECPVAGCNPYWREACLHCRGTGRVPETAERETLARAATVAGWAVLPKWEASSWNCAASYRATSSHCNCYHIHSKKCCFCNGPKLCPRAMSKARRALEATEAWLACPCEEHYNAWYDAWQPIAGDCPWVASPGFPNLNTQEIQSAARATDEQAVRAAICNALIPWLLA